MKKYEIKTDKGIYYITADGNTLPKNFDDLIKNNKNTLAEFFKVNEGKEIGELVYFPSILHSGKDQNVLKEFAKEYNTMACSLNEKNNTSGVLLKKEDALFFERMLLENEGSAQTTPIKLDGRDAPENAEELILKLNKVKSLNTERGYTENPFVLRGVAGGPLKRRLPLQKVKANRRWKELMNPSNHEGVPANAQTQETETIDEKGYVIDGGVQSGLVCCSNEIYESAASYEQETIARRRQLEAQRTKEERDRDREAESRCRTLDR